VQQKLAAMRSQQQLEQYRQELAAGSFAVVIEQSSMILAENESEPPADAALYALGHVYAHPDYEGRDYALSHDYFVKLVENFPASALASEARTFLSLFDTLAAREKAVHELQQKKTPACRPAKVVENLNFQEAVRKNLQLLQEAGSRKQADQALYNLGLIYAHADNPAKDYWKSRDYFKQLISEFPDSDLAEEGRVWLGLFDILEKIQQIDIDIEQQKKELTR